MTGQPVVFIGIERGSPWSSPWPQVEDWISKPTAGRSPSGSTDTENTIYNNYEPTLGSTFL